jgi:hypothetical protein
MTSQVIFTVDTKLKQRAMKKAQREGLPFAAILKLATKAYVEGSFDVGIVDPPFNAKTKREITQALKDIEEGKNLSPVFTTTEEAIAYLRKA